MNNGFKRTALLVLSCASLVAAVGYSSWVVESNKEYHLNNKDTLSKPVAYIVGNERVKYTSIEKALDVAKSGDIVIVVPPIKDNYHPTNNKVVPDKAIYHITRNCTIKNGVFLVIPTDSANIETVKDASSLNTYVKSMKEDDRSRGDVIKDSSGNITNNKPSLGNYADENNYLRITVEIDDGVTLTNEGTLVISGYLGSGYNAGSGMRGQTSSSYSQISLGRNAHIVQSDNNAITHCYGYIKKTSSIGSSFELTSGSLYIPFIVDDYKGFQMASGMADDVKNEKCSAFNQFEIRNIQVTTNINYGANVIGIVNVYMQNDFGGINEVIHKELKLIGNASSSALIMLTSSDYSSVKARFDSKTNILNLTIIGMAKIGNLDFKLSVKGFNVDLSTSTAFFPLNYRINVSLAKAEGQSGEAVFDSTGQMLKILPGSSLAIDDGCNLKISELIVYSCFVDGSQGQTPTHKYGSASAYPLKPGGIVSCSPTGKITGTKIGGMIYSDNSSNIVASNSQLVVSKEPWNQKQSGIQYVTDDYLEIREKLSIVPMANLTKNKGYIGMNVFTKTNSYLPSANLVIGDINQTISNTQCVIFIDEGQDTLTMTPLKNIYNAKIGASSS